jgi:hypothetical protein
VMPAVRLGRAYRHRKATNRDIMQSSRGNMLRFDDVRYSKCHGVDTYLLFPQSFSFLSS